MPPPKLAADAPVADVLVPGLERLGIPRGVKAELAFPVGALRAATVRERFFQFFRTARRDRSLTVAARIGVSDDRSGLKCRALLVVDVFRRCHKRTLVGQIARA